MWVFTTMGFFSAVRIEENVADKLELSSGTTWMMVRGRVREDIKNLLSLWYELHAAEVEQGMTLLVPGEEHEVIEWSGRDYPYRLIMPREHWATCMERLSSNIDYPNFKNEVKAVQDKNRARLYGRVWGVMYGAERALKDDHPGAYRGLFEDEPEFIRTPGRIKTPLPSQRSRRKKKKRR